MSTDSVKEPFEGQRKAIMGMELFEEIFPWWFNTCLYQVLSRLNDFAGWDAALRIKGEYTIYMNIGGKLRNLHFFSCHIFKWILLHEIVLEEALNLVNLVQVCQLTSVDWKDLIEPHQKDFNHGVFSTFFLFSITQQWCLVGLFRLN